MGDLYYRDKVYIFGSELGNGAFLASCGGHQESSYGKESDSSPEMETRERQFPAGTGSCLH